ncbi:hypothetical protein A6P54_12445 [Bacillus sp. MKU004]|nr:hypothetical protein A6P54_12445 [Bacillus sp. MKU004]
MKYLIIILFLVVLIFTIIFGVNILKEDEWTGAWTASMQAPHSKGISHEGFKDKTIRMIIQPHIEGGKLRLRLSNTFSQGPLKIEEVRIAVSRNHDVIVPDTDHIVKFDGEQAVTILPGKDKTSDSIPFKVDSQQPLAVSLYVKDATGPVDWHPRSIQTNYITEGNKAGDEEWPAYRQEEESWFWIEAVDVQADKSVKGALVVLGSSIANGNQSTINDNHRWPDYLSDRMKESETLMSVLNAGISGNQLIESTPDKGESALERIHRDVFDQTAVKAVILHQGLNDIRHHPEYSAKDITKAMKKIIEKTHKEGLKIYGGTLTPYKGSGMFTEEGEKVRQEVNDWIRKSGEFDGVIDFDKAVRDPKNTERYLPEYDAGDHLHPNDAGYEKMADAVDLSMFK